MSTRKSMQNSGDDAFSEFDVDTNDTNPGMNNLFGVGDTLDLSDVPERQKFEAIPPGIYDANIDSVELGTSQRSGNPMLTWTLKTHLPDGRDRTMFYHTVLKDGGLSRLKRLLVRLSPYANEPVNVAAFKPSDAALYFTGTPCRVRLRTQPYQGELRNSVSDILAPEGEPEDFS